MSTSRWFTAFIAVIAVTTPGCEEFEEFLPTVRFDSLSANEIDFQRADVDFVFQVDNPNPVSIKLANFNYNLALQEVSLLKGDDADGFELEAVGSSELRLPVELGWESVWETINATRGLDVVDFGLQGKFGFDTPIGEVPLRYNEDGDFPALRTPKFSFKRLSAEPFDIFDPTARLNLELNVDNPHGSTLFFDEFVGNVTLGGQPLAASRINTFEISGATEGKVNLPITLDLLSAGTTLVSAIINGDKLNLGLNAQMDVDTPFGIVPLTVDESGQLNVEL